MNLDRTTLLHLPDGLAARPLEVDPAYWEHRATAPELGDGRIVSVFGYRTTWDWWERHPTGDEFAFVLSGDIDLLLDGDTGPSAVALRAGQGAIVPEGAWHRVVVNSPSELLFITPTPARTEHRDA